MTIENWRSEIDEIDAELLKLLNRRAQIAVEVGALKRDAGLKVCDPDRERDVLGRVCTHNHGPLNDRAVGRIFRRIIFESRRLETQFLKSVADDRHEVLS